jgi:hypothetical protein
VPWILEEIELEWFGGMRLHWDPKDVESAFDVATRIRGLAWVLGAKLDPTLLPPLVGIGIRGGYSEFLRVYWFGMRMGSILGAKGADNLIARVIAGDADANEEAGAIHLLRSQQTNTDLEVEPEVRVGTRDRKPDFRIRKGDERWVYVEVTKLHSSSASARVQRLLERIGDGVMAVERPFLMEILFNREPTEEEEQLIVLGAIGACGAPEGHRVEIADIASILVKAGDPQVVVPSPIPDDDRPRMAISRGIGGPGSPSRQLIARIPFADERADEILRREAKQLPKDECGLLMANVNSQPSAFESWGERVPERFRGGLHTRVAAVILFMHATTSNERGLVWVPYVKLIPNPHAVAPLPAWITETVAAIRENTRRLTGRPD